MQRRSFLAASTATAASAAAAALTCGRSVRAQTSAWTPTKAIQLVVPFSPGGTTDVLARRVATRVSQALGQPVVVDNKAGAGGSIGASFVAKAPPDGHTLLLHNLTFPLTTTVLDLAGRPPHVIERDFTPISLLANVPFMILLNPSVQGSNLREFVEFYKSGATPLNYGSTGPGSTQHIMGSVVQSDGGINMTHIPYRGAAPQLQALMTGEIQFGCDQIVTCLQHIRSGAVKAVATASSSRVKLLPNVPTVREMGFPSMELNGWNGVFAPARTPAPIVERLAFEFRAAMQLPENARAIEEQGAEPLGTGPQELATVVAQQLTRFRPIIQRMKITPSD